MTPPTSAAATTGVPAGTPDVAAAPAVTGEDAQGATAGTTRKPRQKKPRPPMLYGRKGRVEIIFLWIFVTVPLLAVAAAVPVFWGWGLSWVDVGIYLFFHILTGLGITVGYHRYFTHGAFKTKRWLRIAMAFAGSLAIEGAPIRWVADHRRHHQFAEEAEDPHSPWRFGESTKGLFKGMVWAHVGWLFTRENTNSRRFAPDLVADPDIRWFQKRFPLMVLASLLLPTIAGGLITWSWQGALSAYFWGGLVRIAVVHHITWSVNSVCHVMGERPFTTTDKATNNRWLAILSLGESWHNLHHADPTCARHGVEKGQIDISARVIWAFEKLGWAWDVRWPNADRLDAKRKKPEAEVVAA